MSAKDDQCSWRDRVELKEYLEAKIDAIKEAIAVARAEMDRRLEGMNEMRSQLNKQAADFMSKEIYETKHELLDKRIDVLEKFQAVSEGKASQLSVLIVGAGMLLSIIISGVALWHSFNQR